MADVAKRIEQECGLDLRLHALQIRLQRLALQFDEQGLTGSWYEASEDGQGFEIEVYPDLIAAGTVGTGTVSFES